MTYLWHIHHKREYVGSYLATCFGLYQHFGKWLVIDPDTYVVHVTRLKTE